MRRAAVVLLILCLALSLCAPAYGLEPSYRVSYSYASGEFYPRLLAVELTGNRALDLLKVGLSQLGYHEGERWDYSGADGEGNGNYTEYGYAFPFDGEEWCAMFVAWCARQAGIGRDAIGHTALANPNYFGLPYYDPAAYSPKTGDLVFFGTDTKWTHVAMVLAVTDSRIYTLDGNSNDAVRLNSIPKSSGYIKAYSPWTWETSTLSELGVGRLHTLNFNANGGGGSMQSVCLSDLRPVALYVNQIETDDDTGEPLYTHYVSRRGLEFSGWYVKRDADGLWLTDSGFVPAETIVAGEAERLIIPDGAELSADAEWSAETFPTFTLYAVWKDSEGGYENNTAAHLARPDSTGWLNPFWDLAEGEWYYESVKGAVDKGLMEGMGNNTFSPESSITRAQAVTLIHRISGSPPAESEAEFSDAPKGSWYFEALSWACENGYVEGMGGGVFSPDSPLTGYQLLTLLHRMDETAAADDIQAEDETPEAVPEWAAQAVKWAGAKSLFADDAPAFDGAAPVTRAVCAYVLDRLY